MSNVTSPSETTGTRYVSDGYQSIPGGFAGATAAAGVTAVRNPVAASPAESPVAQASV